MEHGGGALHCREFVGIDDERMGWAFAVERKGLVEVEELFVRPQYRGKGYGKKLIRLLGELASERGLKIWVSYADNVPENLAIIEKLISPLGLQLKASDVRWAPLVATAGADVPAAELLRSFCRGGRPRARCRPEF
jgi:GNAT superfamily N-acetyltransferase